MNLREERAKSGISQGDLARRMGLSQTTVSKMESGERSISPGEETLLRVALAPQVASTEGMSVRRDEAGNAVTVPPGEEVLPRVHATSIDHPSEPNATVPESRYEKHKPKAGRRAYVCAHKDCTNRRFLLPGDDVPQCTEHGRMVVQGNHPYRGAVL